jgi:GT2 family glycosyltransferase
MIVINDGLPYDDTAYSGFKGEIIQHNKNRGVGFSKNEALTYLLKNDCDFIFLMEDDIIIEDANVFDKYIAASIVTGLRHLNFAYHGPANKDENGAPKPRKVVNYGGEINISLHSHLAGAFSFYTSELLKEVGLLDPFYKNAYEHLDHTLKIINCGYNPPFRWFPDLTESYLYISDQDPFLKNSIIRQNLLFFRLRYKYYSWYFKKKNGSIVEDIPDSSEYIVLNKLDDIRNKYGQKI